jgi:RNA polymerase sigma-70 factor (sigma-E family)
MTSDRTGRPLQVVRPAAAASGSERAVAFEALFDRERTAMVRVAYLLVGDEAIAEEVVHDGFATVFERWDQLDNPGGYLRQCVVNGARRVQRRRSVERRHQPMPPEAGVDPQARELLDALAGLPERWRAVVVLRFYADLTPTEIAEVLDVRLGTVKSSLHRGLAQLRTVVER